MWVFKSAWMENKIKLKLKEEKIIIKKQQKTKQLFKNIFNFPFETVMFVLPVFVSQIH